MIGIGHSKMWLIVFLLVEEHMGLTKLVKERYR